MMLMPRSLIDVVDLQYLLRMNAGVTSDVYMDTVDLWHRCF
jgi:hypothetical protein